MASLKKLLERTPPRRTLFVRRGDFDLRLHRRRGIYLQQFLKLTQLRECLQTLLCFPIFQAQSNHSRKLIYIASN
jgi:hypothetical protein